MKSVLLAAAAAVAAISASSGVALADKSYTPNWRPHGMDTKRVYRPAPRVHYHHYEYRPVYRPTPIQRSRADLAERRRDAFADGRITFIEKLKLNAAQRRHESLVRSYRY
jgi:hypothetical protein